MSPELEGTALRRGGLIPSVSLLDGRTGSPVSLSSFRQRSGLLLLLLHGACERCDEFGDATAASTTDLLDIDVVPRTVAPASRANEPSRESVPVVLDPSCRFTKAVLGPDGEVPVVLLVDRFNSPWHAWNAWGHEFPSQREVVETAVHMMLTCDDCSAPLW